MGCLPVQRKHANQVYQTKSVLNSSFSSIRESLHSQILQLHSLSLSCKKGIETCLLDSKKEVAVIIRHKQKYIKAQLENLQKLIRKVDMCIDNSITEKLERKEIIKEVNVFNKEVILELIEDDVEKIVNDICTLERVKTELKNFTAEDKDVELEIEHEFQINEMLKAEGKKNRRRYNRKYNTSNI